jgi:hypothetical protein
MLNQKRRAKKLRNRKMRSRTLGRCADCGRPFLVTEEYILRNAIWDQAARRDERLHSECFEKRLGRPMRAGTFVPCFWLLDIGTLPPGETLCRAVRCKPLGSLGLRAACTIPARYAGWR